MAYLSGKQAFLQILKTEGVSVMFGNPGTTELPLMDGLAREPGIRYVLALQEAVAISMADAYAQAHGGLAAVNVHVSPGLGNAMGMLYDAYKAHSPLLLTAGQHDQSFTVTEPILWSDLPPVATPFVKWATEARRADRRARDARGGVVDVQLPVHAPALRGLDAAPGPGHQGPAVAPRPALLRGRRSLHALAALRRGSDAAGSRRRPPRRGPVGAGQKLSRRRGDPGRSEGIAARAHRGGAPPRGQGRSQGCRPAPRGAGGQTRTRA